MRDAEREEAFLSVFVISERRERYRIMLSNPKRRRAFLDRLNHNLDFIPTLARQIAGGQHSAVGVVRLLNGCGVRNSDTVYVISDDVELDAQYFSMQNAVEQVIQSESGSIVCCIPGRLAYYRTEAPERGYVLKKAV